MNQNLAKNLANLFVVIFTVAFTGLAAAHGDRDGDRHGERVATTWLIGDAINTYDVDAPVNPPLLYVKKRFMAQTGLPVKHATHYIVEKVVSTSTTGTTYTRDPSLLPPGAVPPPPVVTTTTSYMLLDDSMSLKELGIVAGDTLRIREMDNHDLSAPHDNRRHRSHEDHDGDDNDRHHHH